MRDSFPSVTAMYVAYARALATHAPELRGACDDPYAEQLLPAFVARRLAGLGDTRRGRALGSLLRGASFGLVEHLALRTALIDRALERATTAGIEQVVVLGAGLDARAHRASALAHADVYEVDHPATQKFKRERAAALPLAARSLRYVACDFVETRLEDALLASDFDATRPSVWIWEGVTMYLPRAAVESSLASIARLSPRSSLLIATYLTPEIAVAGDAIGRLAARTFGLFAEPLRFSAEPSELAELLARAGFTPLSDAAPKDAAPHFGITLAAFTPGLPSERLVVATRDGEQT